MPNPKNTMKLPTLQLNTAAEIIMAMSSRIVDAPKGVDLAPSYAPTILLGSPGIGKTAVNSAVFRQLATQRQRPLTYLTQLISGFTEGDVRGFPFVREVLRGEDKKLVAVWAESSLLAPLWDAYAQHGDDGIYVLDLDELFQGFESVVKVVGQLLTERRIGEHTLPPRTIIVGASNLMSDRAGVVRQMTHIINRLFLWKVNLDIPTWQAWATREGLHPQYVSFVSEFSNLFIGDDARPPTDANTPFLTARSLTNAEGLHTLFCDSAPDPASEAPPTIPAEVKGFASAPADARPPAHHSYVELDTSPVMREVVAGAVGVGAANTMFTHFELADRLPSAKEIFDDPEGCRLPPESEPAALAQMIFILPSLCPSGTKSTSAFLDDTSEEYLALSALMRCANRLPLAYRLKAYTGFVQRTSCRAFAMPEIKQFITEHSVVIGHAM